jgi:hypothetical protein
MGCGVGVPRATRERVRRAAAVEAAQRALLVEHAEIERAELEQFLDAAALFHGRITGSRGRTVELGPGEAIYLYLPAVSLAAAHRFLVSERFDAGFAFARDRQIKADASSDSGLAGDPGVGGKGTLTVTTERIVFDGEHLAVTWPYDRLSAIEHAVDRPCSLIRANPDAEPVVLIYPAAVTPQLRFMVTLAWDRFTGGAQGLDEQLERSLADLGESAAPTAVGPRTDEPRGAEPRGAEPRLSTAGEPGPDNR